MKKLKLKDLKLDSKDIIQNIGAGLCLLDRRYQIIWFNQHQADWIGPLDKLRGMHCYKAFERRPHICPGCPTRKVFKSGSIQNGKLRIAYTKEGEKRYFQLVVSPIKDESGRVKYALELVQDITERVLRERRKLLLGRRIKKAQGNFSAANRRLRRNLHRVKNIVNRILQSQLALKKRYRKSKSEAVNMKKELQDIFKINRALSSSLSSKKITSMITKFTCELMHTDACNLRLLNDDKEMLILESSYGLSESYARRARVVKLSESIVGEAVKNSRPVIFEDIYKKKARLKFKKLMKGQGFKSGLCVPVVFQRRALGTISAYSRKPRAFSHDEIEILSIFASQIAVAIQESRHYDDIHMNYFNTIHTLALALESRDVYTRGHTERVTRYALRIGRALQIPELDLEILRYAAQVHDIGKISVPDSILNKPGKLTPAERAIIELHPVKGAEVIEPLAFLKPAIPIVRHHHERYDGTGYPDGLSRENIPLLSRILACADAFDAMTSERPYRKKKMTIEEALDEMRHNIGSQFDPKIFRLFVKSIEAQLSA
ncbi:HD domain-containing phosphohydrolase [Candidatus Omnitrophota bacterium]